MIIRCLTDIFGRRLLGSLWIEAVDGDGFTVDGGAFGFLFCNSNPENPVNPVKKNMFK